MKLRLHPDIVVAWRGPHSIQIGLDERNGLVLQQTDAHLMRVVDALRRGNHTLAELRKLAVRGGLAADDADDLVRRLTDRGALLQPAPSLPGNQDVRPLVGAARSGALRYPGSTGWDVLRRRMAATVLLETVGPSTPELAATLLEAGIGSVLVSDQRRLDDADLDRADHSPTAVGRPMERVLSERVNGVRVTHTGADADLVVLSADGVPPAASAGRHVREDRPHLPVVMRERDAVVGPLVRPGRTACLRCIDLHRRERDPDWPLVAGQVAGHRFGPRDPVLVRMVAAIAAGQVLIAIDGWQPATCEGATIEIDVEPPVPTVREWPMHGSCGCNWPPGVAQGH